MKTIIFIAALLTSLPGHSQAHIDFGAGISKDAPVMKLSVGYQINNIVTEAFMQPTMTRRTTPNYFGLRLGYNFHGFVPSVGYLYDYKSADDKEINGFLMGYALKYQLQINENGGLYLEAMYAKTTEITAGFHVQF